MSQAIECRFVKEQASGVTISIRVKPRCSKKGPLEVQVEAAELKWGVSSAPVDGEANSELIESVAKVFAVRKSDISILVGKTSRSKVICIRGLTLDAVYDALKLTP